MGTNYYFTPKKFELGRVKKLHEDYSSKLDKLLKNYIKSYNKLCNEMSKETNDLFESQELSDYNNWWNYMHLAEIEYPELHICKISMGWKPLFEAHSIGNAYFIRFCEEKKYIPKLYIAVAPGAVYEYPTNRNDYIVEVKKQSYVKKQALDYMKQAMCNKFCLYSDEDDNNKEKFTRFIDDTNSKGIYLKDYNHFDGYHNIYKIPELISLINELL